MKYSAKALCEYVLGVSWIRCLMEEGVDFVDQRTNEPEFDENTIYGNYLKNTKAFVLPKANASPKGYDKNIREVLGSFLLEGDAERLAVLTSAEFRSLMLAKIDIIRSKDTT
jgi:hypothetical protein